MRAIDKALYHRQETGFRHRLSRFLGWDRHERPPLPEKPRDYRGPVEHGPTKSPFSRERRRLRNRAAHRSFMVNQQRR